MVGKYPHADMGIFFITAMGTLGISGLIGLIIVFYERATGSYEPARTIGIAIMVCMVVAMLWQFYLSGKEQKEMEREYESSKKVQTITIEDVKPVSEHLLGVVDSNHVFYYVGDNEAKMYIEKGKTLTVETEKYPTAEHPKIRRVISR